MQYSVQKTCSQQRTCIVDIHLVLCSQYETSDATDARHRLQSHVRGISCKDKEELEGRVELDKEQPKACVDVKQRSPCTQFFRSVLTDVEDTVGDHVAPLNVTYSPSSFAQVTSYCIIVITTITASNKGGTLNPSISYPAVASIIMTPETAKLLSAAKRFIVR